MPSSPGSHAQEASLAVGVGRKALMTPHKTFVRTILALALSLTIPASGLAASESTSYERDGSTITAVVSYTEVDEYEIADLRVTITSSAGPSSGAVLYDEPATSKQCDASYCKPQTFFGEGPSLEFKELTGGGEPELILHLYTGGANCCAVLNIYSWNGTTYVRSVREFTGGIPRELDLNKDGVYEFLASDGRFKGRYTSTAGSYSPVQILSLSGGTWSDVTSSYRAIVKNDARRALKVARSQCRRTDGETLGAYAAWTANQYRLKNRRKALSTLQAERRRGCLRSSAFTTGGRVFIGRLDRFIRSLKVYS